MATDVAYISNITHAVGCIKHKMQVTEAPLPCSLAASMLHYSLLVYSMSSIQYVMPVTAMCWALLTSTELVLPVFIQLCASSNVTSL